MNPTGSVPAPRAAHVLQRSPGRRALLAPAPQAGHGDPVAAVALKPLGPGYAFASQRATMTWKGTRPAQHWYRAREVDPDSPDDIASLALLRWWSRTSAERMAPDEFPAFLREFAQWWIRHPECRLAVLSEEVGPDATTTPVPVAMGWVIPRPDLAVTAGAPHTPAVSDGVFVLPGTPGPRVRRDLAAALGRLAASRGLHLTPLTPLTPRR